MTETMTSAGLDAHARSIDAVAICVATGELTRRRFGSGPGPVIGWLKRFRGRCTAAMRLARPGTGYAVPLLRQGSGSMSWRR
jgi:hypothetical protein